MLEKTLESPWDFKEINQSILKEINLKYSLEGLNNNNTFLKQSFLKFYPKALNSLALLNTDDSKNGYINQTNNLKPPSITHINSVLNISQVTCS